MSMLESLCQRFGGARHHDQVHVIRHEAVTQQSKTVKVRVVPEQLQVCGVIAVAGQYDLPCVATLSNMMGYISHYHTGEACHGLKVSDNDSSRAEAG